VKPRRPDDSGHDIAATTGRASNLLGVGAGAPVTYLVPVLIVGVMSGLSMDYQVFLVSRIHEEWSHTPDNSRAVRSSRPRQSS